MLRMPDGMAGGEAVSRPNVYCRTSVGARDRSIHLANTYGNNGVRPACKPELAGKGGGFDKCRGPATCVVCRSTERNGR